MYEQNQKQKKNDEKMMRYENVQAIVQTKFPDHSNKYMGNYCIRSCDAFGSKLFGTDCAGFGLI